MTGGPVDLNVLFEEVQIGPVTAPNRFYQVPHCSGMARAHPKGLARMREIKAEGGWGVVCTEQCDFHPSSNHLRELQLWDERHERRIVPVVEGIHRHGALAGVELAHNGRNVANLESRVHPLAPSSVPVRGAFPVTAREMSKKDIVDFRRWHRDAVARAMRCGFDIIYIYAGHSMTLPVHFLSPQLNQRSDEYGGSLTNRMRLLRELLEDAREVAEGHSAIALRFGVDTLPYAESVEQGQQEAFEVVQELAELPDLWDVTLADFSLDGATSRSMYEGHEARWTSLVKGLSTKPVVGVGWFTSPDVMAGQVKNGHLDLVGSARASIADPFLPSKVRGNDLGAIRECIGCNICLASDTAGVPLRCSQNPTMGEEWRRDWHPHHVSKAVTSTSVLVVGAGPAGLEASRLLAERGHDVVLAEAGDRLGGHLLALCDLPGLGAWRRVIDWRAQQLRRLPVEVALESRIAAADIDGSTFTHVAIATGAEWRRDGVGHLRPVPIDIAAGSTVLTPDDVLGGVSTAGEVLVYDDDHYVMAALISLRLAQAGCRVTYVTPSSLVAEYTSYTNEQKQIHAQVLRACQAVHLLTMMTAIEPSHAIARDVYTQRPITFAHDQVVLVTGRRPRDQLFHELGGEDVGQRAIARVGDSLAPGTIASAVHSGHLYGMHLETSDDVAGNYKREQA